MCSGKITLWCWILEFVQLSHRWLRVDRHLRQTKCFFPKSSPEIHCCLIFHRHFCPVTDSNKFRKTSALWCIFRIWFVRRFLIWVSLWRLCLQREFWIRCICGLNRGGVFCFWGELSRFRLFRRQNLNFFFSFFRVFFWFRTWRFWE